MTNSQRAGVLGLGLYLPPETRTNDWWDPAVVARWIAPRDTTPPAMPAQVTPGMASVMAGMRSQSADPFRGGVLRHVMPASMQVVDMEAAAARDAIERAAVDPASIDLVLTSAAVQELLLTNHACDLHERLGLPRRCLSLEVEACQHAFPLQLALAESMILAGRAQTALLVQSSAMSRILDYTDPLSGMFGDGAAAVVVGRVGPDRGVLAMTHMTDGSHPYTMVAGVPGGRWFDAGQGVLHLRDAEGMRDILLRTVDLTVDSIHAVLAEAGRTAADVDVFCMHQGMPWLRRVVQEHASLQHARAVDTFERTGHLFGAFTPSTLYAAERDGLIRPGDLVLIAGGGNGMTYGAIALVWGR